MKGRLPMLLLVSLVVLLTLNLSLLSSHGTEPEPAADRGHGKPVSLAACRLGSGGSPFVLFRMFEDGHVEVGFTQSYLERIAADDQPVPAKGLDITWR